MTDSKVLALANFLKIDEDNILDNYDHFSIANSKAEYLVLTDDEADDRFEEVCKDIIFDDVPHQFLDYILEEHFIEDCRTDGRGHHIADHDGHEHEVDLINDEGFITDTFFIYRIN